MNSQEPTSIEDRVRVATQVGATLVQDVQPFTEPEKVRYRRHRAPGTRRWVSWGVPLAAAAAVVLVALGLVAVRHLSAPGPSGPAVGPASVPRYYVALDQEQFLPVGPAASSGRAGPMVLIVGDDQTGKAIATVNAPRGMEFEGVQGASDDRTFVVAATGPARPGVPPYTWYLLRLAPGTAQPGRLTKLPIKLPGSVADVRVYAPSPDGRDVAIESLDVRSGKASTRLAVYSLSSGAELRAWTANSDITQGLAEDTLSWLSDGRQLVFSDQSDSVGSAPSARNMLRTIDLSGSGADLLTDSRELITVSSPVSRPATCWMLEATPDGGFALCGTQYSVLTSGGTSAGCARGGLEFTAYSTRTGRPVRVIYRYPGACQYGYTEVLWLGADARSSVVALEFVTPGPAGKQRGLLGVAGNGRLRLLPMAKSVPAAAYVNVAF